MRFVQWSICCDPWRSTSTHTHLFALRAPKRRGIIINWFSIKSCQRTASEFNEIQFRISERIGMKWNVWMNVNGKVWHFLRRYETICAPHRLACAFFVFLEHTILVERGCNSIQLRICRLHFAYLVALYHQHRASRIVFVADMRRCRRARLFFGCTRFDFILITIAKKKYEIKTNSILFFCTFSNNKYRRKAQAENGRNYCRI